jgi:hypothetical protein
MTSPVDVSRIFSDILVHAMQQVNAAHGAHAAHRLFFELYDHTFTFLEREYGSAAVEAFWASIADHRLGDLETLMREKGFKGMEEYWRATLGQEGADYEMQTTEHSFFVRVKRCPPNEWFKTRGLAKYPRYCDHCRVLYGRVGGRCGYAMEYFPPDEKAGVCCGVRFTKNVPATAT